MLFLTSISEDLKVKAEYVQVDFSNATDADYARVAKALEGKTVTVLGTLLIAKLVVDSNH